MVPIGYSYIRFVMKPASIWPSRWKKYVVWDIRGSSLLVYTAILRKR